MASKNAQNPIAQVRASVALTGAEFASSLGLSSGAIRNMERGAHIPGFQTRELLFIIYGVSSASVSQTKGTALYAPTGEAYTKESYANWKKLTEVSKKTGEEIIARELRRVEVLLKASALNRSLFPTIFRLESGMEEISKQSGVVGLIETLMQEDGKDERWFRDDAGTLGVVDHVLAQLGLSAEGKPRPAAGAKMAALNQEDEHAR